MALVNVASISKNRYFYSQTFLNLLDTNNIPIDITTTGKFPSLEGVDITGWPRLSYYVYAGSVSPVGLVSALEINPTPADDTKWVPLVASITGLVNGTIPRDRVAHRLRLNVTALTSGGIIVILAGSHS